MIRCFMVIDYAPKKQANGLRFSRREASAASEAVGWKRMLGGIMVILASRGLAEPFLRQIVYRDFCPILVQILVDLQHHGLKIRIYPIVVSRSNNTLLIFCHLRAATTLIDPKAMQLPSVCLCLNGLFCILAVPRMLQLLLRNTAKVAMGC